MEGQAGVLQKGIEAPALRCRRIEPGERVGSEQQERVETEGKCRLRPESGNERPARQPVRQCRKRRSRQTEHSDPQEHRALVVPPGRCDLVDERLGAVAVLRHKRDGQIGPSEDQQKHREGEQAEQALDDGQRTNGPVRFQLAAYVKEAEEQSEQRQCGCEP